MFGDDLVSIGKIGSVIPFPIPLMNCSAVIQLLTLNGLDPVWFCQNSQVAFGTTCCNTCSGMRLNIFKS